MSPVRHNLFELYLRLQRHHKRPFTWKEIGIGTGMYGNQVAAIIKQEQTERTSLTNGTIYAFLKYFRSQGLDVDFNDIFTEENDDTHDQPPNPKHPPIDH